MLDWVTIGGNESDGSCMFVVNLMNVLVQPFVLVEHTMSVIEEHLIAQNTDKDRAQHLARGW